MVSINGRFTAHPVTGMQRYAHEVSSRLTLPTRFIKPDKPLKGLKGHAWEQCVLPRMSANNLIWSPCNTGPIFSRNQVVTIHDLIPLDHPEWFTPSFVALYRMLIPRLVSKVRHIVAVSQYTRSRLIQRLGVAESKITVVLNGIGEEFTPQSEEEHLRMQQGLGISGPYVLTVSSVEPRKNLATLLSAWETVGRARPDMKLVVSGLKGNSSVFSQKQGAAAPKNVIFTDYVAQSMLPALYSGAECFVYPSLDEGFGLPVLEALACGVPVVASSSGSLPEIAGPTAALFDPLSPAEIARAILRHTSQSAEAQEAGLRHARQYRWSDCAASTQEVLARFSQ